MPLRGGHEGNLRSGTRGAGQNLEQAMLKNASDIVNMAPGYLSTLITASVLGWLVAGAVALTGYLLALQLREFRRKRSMEEERNRLGLRPGAITASDRPPLIISARLAAPAEPALPSSQTCPRRRSRSFGVGTAVCATAWSAPKGLVEAWSFRHRSRSVSELDR
jgi:hypothetical protein